MERLETLMAFCGMRARKPYQLYWGLLMAWRTAMMMMMIDDDDDDDDDRDDDDDDDHFPVSSVAAWSAWRP
jgi:hypothetical protein